jgi:hypothetical protein
MLSPEPRSKEFYSFGGLTGGLGWKFGAAQASLPILGSPSLVADAI